MKKGINKREFLGHLSNFDFEGIRRFSVILIESLDGFVAK